MAVLVLNYLAADNLSSRRARFSEYPSTEAEVTLHVATATPRIAMSRNQRLVLIASILGSFVAFLEVAVVNVALPAIRRDLGGGISVQQWVADAYLLTLGSHPAKHPRAPIGK